MYAGLQDNDIIFEGNANVHINMSAVEGCEIIDTTTHGDPGYRKLVIRSPKR